MYHVTNALRRRSAPARAAVLLLALCLFLVGTGQALTAPVDTSTLANTTPIAASAVTALAPYPGPHAVPGTVEAEDYDTGGEGVAYHDTTPGNQGGAYRDDDVDIETGAGITDVSWVRAGEWLSYTVTASAPQAVVLRLRVSNPDAAEKQVTILSSDGLYGTIAVPSTGSFSTFTTVNSTLAFLPEGETTFRLFFVADRVNLDRLEIVRAVEPAPVEGPSIGWQRLLGGNGIDDSFGPSLARTDDGGVILIGETSSSANGDVTSTNHGGTDLWLVKLDGGGAIEWQRLLGGSGEDWGSAVQQTTDGGYILLGSSFSSESGDVTGVNHGAADLWVVKVDGAGAIQWQRLLGGDRGDSGHSVQQTADGGYILLGTSSSSANGDVAGTNHGTDTDDLWVVKLDAGGTIQWQQLLGGSEIEDGWSLQQADDGGYVLLGSSGSSASGNVTGTNHGVVDLWVVKLSSLGAIQWQRLLGGSGAEYGWSAQQTADGGSILLGSSSSSASGDVTGTNHDGGLLPGNISTDFWVVKLDAAGAIQWQELLGGDRDDFGRSIRLTADGGYILLGESWSSASGDVTGTRHGEWDLWAVKLSEAGAIQWQRLLGGRGSDNAGSILQAADGGYVLFGDSTSSANGDVAGTNHGNGDIWMVKLNRETPGISTVPGGAGVPTDTNGDGLYDDVNGNGRSDFADIVLYFNQMSWIAANEPVAGFDYNGNGRIDFADVVWLFNHLGGTSGRTFTITASAMGPGEITPSGNVTVPEGGNITFSFVSHNAMPTPHDTQSGYGVHNAVVVDPAATPTPYPTVMPPYFGNFTPSYTLYDVRADHTIYGMFYYYQIIA